MCLAASTWDEKAEGKATAAKADALELRLQMTTAPEVRCLCFQLGGAQLLCTGGADSTVRVR